MPRGDQKRRVMARRQLDEDGYYSFARVVTEKRHFNTRLAALLRVYIPEPLRLVMDWPAFPPADIRADEVTDWIIRDSGCPLTLMHCWMACESDEDLTPWGWLARELGPTTERSLRRHTDSAHLTPAHLRTWCRPEGQPLDGQVMEISVTCGREIDVEEAAAFIVAHPRGAATYAPDTPARRLAEAFYQLTGFRLTRGFANRLQGLLRGLRAPVVIEEEVPF